MASANNLLNNLTGAALDFGWSLARPVVEPIFKYLIADQASNLSKRPRVRLAYSGVERAEYAANVSAFVSVENLYRSINFGALMGVVTREMTEGVNYGTAMGAVERMKRGVNVSPVLAIVSKLESGYNVGGFSLCHQEVGEDAYLGGVLAVAGKVRGRMRGLVTYCDENHGEVVGLVNITGRNGLSKERDREGRKKKGKSYGFVNIDLSRPLLEGGLEFGWS